MKPTVGAKRRDDVRTAPPPTAVVKESPYVIPTPVPVEPPVTEVDGQVAAAAEGDEPVAALKKRTMHILPPRTLLLIKILAVAMNSTESAVVHLAIVKFFDNNPYIQLDPRARHMLEQLMKADAAALETE